MRKSPLVSFFIMSFLILLLPSGPSYASGTQLAVKEYQKANKLFAAAKYKDAIPLYQQVLAAPPEDAALGDIHTKIGDSYFRLGSFRSALASYRSALREQKRSERPVTQYWIGFCCFLIGRDAEAVTEFLKIPEFYPESGMWVATAYYWAGRASERMGKNDIAAGYYRKAGGNGRSTQGRVALKRAEEAKSGSTNAQITNPQ
jgi:tetratricopeptide (TPR) repeat protein